MRPSAAPTEGPVAADTGMVASGVGESIGDGDNGVGDGDGGAGVAGGQVGTVVGVAGAWIASVVGTAMGVVTSVGLVSVGAMLTLGMGAGEEGGASVGVAAAELVAMGVGEGEAVAAGGGVSTASGVLVGIGMGVAVAAGPGVVVAAGVGAAVPLTTTWPPSTVTHWALAAVSNTWTSRNPKSLLPSPWATQVIVAKTPVPLGPGALPKLTTTKITFPSALFTSGPMGTIEFPVLSRKVLRAASVTCRMDGS